MGNAVGKSLAVLLALCVALLTPALLSPAGAADDPYTAGINTRCTVSVPTGLERGDRATIRVGARANAPGDAAPPRGTVRVRMTRDGEQLWSTQVPLRGRAVQVQGPRMDQAGRYVVTTQFAPQQGDVYRGCSGRAGLHVTNGLSPNNEGPGDQGTGPQGGDIGDGTGGLLPDTGGPNSAWLVLALLFLGSGGGLVVAARGRREPDYQF